MRPMPRHRRAHHTAPARQQVNRSSGQPFEVLEQRHLLTADLAVGHDALLSSVDWQGQQVDAVADSWVVRAASPAVAALSLAPGWQSVTLGEGFFAITAPGVGVEDVLGWAAASPDVAYVEPDFAVGNRALPNDPSFSRLWGLENTGQSGGVVDADIDAAAAWDVSTGSRDVVVAVIDSGVDYNHPDLAGNIWVNSREIPGNGVDDDGNGFVDDVRGWDFYGNDADPMDTDGHGTHVAGTIGAVGNNGSGVAGVNWQVSIMPLRFLGPDGGSTSDAIAAVNYVTQLRRSGVNVVATNNSWGGGGFSRALLDAIQMGGQEGILFVAAAGNESNNNDSSPSYPASYTSEAVISVAATDRFNNLASFSNYGAGGVDVAAPGVSIYSTTPGNTYASYSGTSMAAPHVTGLVALAAAASPQSTASQIRSAVLASTTPLASLVGRVATGGLINAAATLAALAGVTPPTDPPPSDPPPADPLPPEPAPAPNEPNDSLVTATTLLITDGSGSFSGVVGDGSYGPRDVDLFGLTLTAGDTLTVDIDARSLANPSGLDSYLRLFDATGRQVAFNDDANGSLDSFLSVTVSAGGSYFIGISAYGNAGYDPNLAGSGQNASTTGSFVASVTVVAAPTPTDPTPTDPTPTDPTPTDPTPTDPTPTDPTPTDPTPTDPTPTDPTPPVEQPTPPAEPNDSLVSASVLGVITGTLSLSAAIGDNAYGSRDVDLYRLELTAGDSLTVDIDAETLPNPSLLDSYVRLFDATGRQLASNDDAGGSWDSFLAFTARTSGTYYVGISSYGNSRYDATREGSGRRGRTSGDYMATISVTNSVPNDGGADVGLPMDAGDTIATARIVDPAMGPTSLSGRIGDGRQLLRDVDMYAITLAAGQRVVVDIDAQTLAGGSTLDSYLRLLDAGGREVAVNDDASGSLDSRLTFTARVAGTYYVGVSGYGNSRYSPTREGSGWWGSVGDYAISFDLSTPTRGNRVLGFRDVERTIIRQAAFAALAGGTETLGTFGPRRLF